MLVSICLNLDIFLDLHLDLDLRLDLDFNLDHTLPTSQETSTRACSGTYRVHKHNNDVAGPRPTSHATHRARAKRNQLS